MSAEEHAFLAPSAAHIWGPGGCSAYPTVAAQFPQEDTPQSREGSAAHWYNSETLLGREPAEGALAPNGHPVTEEMIDCGADFIADCRALMASGAIVRIEQRMDMPTIHPTLNWGTADLIGIDPERETIYVRDYKFGHGYVDAWENWQLVDYAVGAARHFGVEITPDWTINAAIYQPRCYHPEGPRKLWPVDGARFLELADSLAHAARKATEFDAPATTGEHCDYCEGRHACDALYRAGGRAIDVSLRSPPRVMDEKALGLTRTHIAKALARLEALASGLDAQILAINRAGKRTPGWELTQNETNEKFTVPVDEVFILGDMLGVETRKPAASITPHQMRGLLKKKGLDDAVISAYAKRGKGELKVTPTNDTKAAKAFK